MNDDSSHAELLELTSEIVAAHLSNNTLPISDLPQLIRDIYKTLASVGDGQTVKERPQPAISVKKSVSPDFPLRSPRRSTASAGHRRLSLSFASTVPYCSKWILNP